MNNIEISENGEMIIRNGNQVIRMNGNGINIMNGSNHITMNQTGIHCNHNHNNMNINISSNVNYYQQSDQSYESDSSSLSDTQDSQQYQQQYVQHHQYSQDEDEEDYQDNQQIGLNQQQINEFPIRRVNTDQKDQTCSICLQEFMKHEYVRRLFCMHEFHKDCIDDWLLQKATCVICQQNMLQYL